MEEAYVAVGESNHKFEPDSGSPAVSDTETQKLCKHAQMRAICELCRAENAIPYKEDSPTDLSVIGSTDVASPPPVMRPAKVQERLSHALNISVTKSYLTSVSESDSSALSSSAPPSASPDPSTSPALPSTSFLAPSSVPIKNDPSLRVTRFSSHDPLLNANPRSHLPNPSTHFGGATNADPIYRILP
eukprot:gb/GEZN01012524.1/.p1 GENE.gb/GEZN01012524.1/~~gb/GEZN01012524.1/.p1  ORF type:complete len:188 (-),score=21.97 gb/GEZN01012524.1/:345-908(-)